MINLLSEVAQITPTRNFNTLYIVLDTIFCLVFLALLVWKKRYQTAIFALAGGILYTIVDFGGFYLMSHARTVMINGQLADAMGTFWVLLWMSMSYGITNFAFMWVLMAKDKFAKYWIFLIVMWWMCAPTIAEMGGEATIQTSRTTGAYHGWMAVVMVVDYIILTIILLAKKDKKPFVNILYLNLIGFAVQFGWEFALLINGIRPMNDVSLRTLIINSCIETNMGMPTTFLVFWLMRKFRNEDLSKPQKVEVQETREVVTE